MDLIPDPRTPCMVKVIVNPRTEECFNVKWTLYPNRTVNVKIITPNIQQLKSIINEMKKELENHILPFWMRLYDSEFGGFYGKVDENYIIKKTSEKGSILNSRILFAFSQSYNYIKNEKIT